MKFLDEVLRSLAMIVDCSKICSEDVDLLSL